MGNGWTYQAAGVDTQTELVALKRLTDILRPTEVFLPMGKGAFGHRLFRCRRASQR